MAQARRQAARSHSRTGTPRSPGWLNSGCRWSAAGAAEKRDLRSWCTLRLSVRRVSTSLNSLVASFNRERRLSITVWEWSALCLFGPPPEKVLRSEMAWFRAWMSCFTTVDSSLISSAGSSNMEVRLASCARRCSFCEVLWMPMPILAARRANSDWWEPPLVPPPLLLPARGVQVQAGGQGRVGGSAPAQGQAATPARSPFSSGRPEVLVRPCCFCRRSTSARNSGVLSSAEDTLTDLLASIVLTAAN